MRDQPATCRKWSTHLAAAERHFLWRWYPPCLKVQPPSTTEIGLRSQPLRQTSWLAMQCSMFRTRSKACEHRCWLKILLVRALENIVRPVY
jgi:hypothetical protein